MFGHIVWYLQDYPMRLILAELMFMFFLPRRSKYAVRLLAWLPIIVLPNIFSHYIDPLAFRIGNYTWSFLMWYAYSAFAVVLCHKARAADFAYIFVSAYAMQNLYADLEWCIRVSYGLEVTVQYAFIALAFMLAIYAGCFFLLVRPWARKMAMNISVSKIYLVVISVFVLLVLNVLSSFMVNLATTPAMQAEQGLLFGICTAVTLVLMAGAYDRSYIQYERETMERMLFEQDRQRKLSEQTIDLINMKCHDMKHQIEALKNGGGDFYDKAVQSISIYDSYFNTGNRSLDLVLTEKSLRCNNLKVNFSCIAEGGLLSFMSSSDIYSFFGNAIDNALECLVMYPEEKRNLSINVRRIGGNYVGITVENYCEGDLDFENGLPRTTKQNEKGFHGYGTRSMKYIIEELYGGTLVMRRSGDVFSVAASLPQTGKKSHSV